MTVTARSICAHLVFIGQDVGLFHSSLGARMSSACANPEGSILSEIPPKQIFRPAAVQEVHSLRQELSTSRCAVWLHWANQIKPWPLPGFPAMRLLRRVL